MRFFITEGPVNCTSHYCLPPLQRFDLAAYADRGGADEAHLVIFDRRLERTWDERIWVQTAQHNGQTITVWGM